MDSKIDMLDSPQIVTHQICKVIAAPGVTEENDLLAFAEFVLLPAMALNGWKEFIVGRSQDELEPLVYSSIEQMRDNYQRVLYAVSSVLRTCFCQKTDQSFS